MAFDKGTFIGYHNAGTWPETQQAFFQREGEAGLSQSVTLSFEGFSDEERERFASAFNAMQRLAFGANS